MFLGAAGAGAEGPVPLLVSSTVAEFDDAALAEALAPRVEGFDVRVAGPQDVDATAYRLVVSSGVAEGAILVAFTAPGGAPIERSLDVDPSMPNDLRLRVIAVTASHLVGEPAPPSPAPPPVPPPGALAPTWPEEPPAPPLQEPSGFLEFALSGGASGNVTDVGGGEGFGPAAFVHLRWGRVRWAAAVDLGWHGVFNEPAGLSEPMTVVPLRIGADFRQALGAFEIAPGARIATDLWTARYQQREIGLQIGFSLGLTLSWFPFERFGFVAKGGLDAYPEAVILRIGGEGVFQIAHLRWLGSFGFAVRP